MSWFFDSIVGIAGFVEFMERLNRCLIGPEHSCLNVTMIYCLWWFTDAMLRVLMDAWNTGARGHGVME
eukprot:7351172-Lingulodinium_polyedra.AAC.1